MAARGAKPGERRGGRKAGVPNKVGAEVRAIAGKYTKDAIERLAFLMKNAESEQAQVSACKELLDRAHGRPAQAVTGEDGVGPVKLEIVWAGSKG